jgi:putative addiction module CopG family antidote
MAISIVLEDQLQASMDRLITSGQFESHNDVVAKGIALIEAQQARLLDFDRAISQGWDDSQSNHVTDVDAAFDTIEAKWRARAAAQAA